MIARFRGVLVLVLAAGACDQQAGEENRGAPSPTPLRVVVQPYLHFAPLHIARAEGLFEAHGLAVDFVRLPSTDQGVPALITGAVDILPGLAVPGILNAIAKGAPIRAVADKGYVPASGCSSMGVVTRPGLLAESQAAGTRPRIRRLSTGDQAPMQYIVDRAIGRVGLSIDSIEVVRVPHLAEIKALHDGTLDAALTGEPWFSRAVAAGDAEAWIGEVQAVPGFQYAFILFGPKLLQKDRAAGQRFIKAYLEGVRRYAQGKTERNVEILASATGEDAALLRQMCWPTFRPDGRIDFGGLVDYQAWGVQKGLIDAAVSEEQFWDSSFVENAQRLGRN